MNQYKEEESLLSELRLISGRLGDVMAEFGMDRSVSGRMVLEIQTDLEELRSRISDRAAMIL